MMQTYVLMYTVILGHCIAASSYINDIALNKGPQGITQSISTLSFLLIW